MGLAVSGLGDSALIQGGSGLRTQGSFLTGGGFGSGATGVTAGTSLRRGTRFLSASLASRMRRWYSFSVSLGLRAMRELISLTVLTRYARLTRERRRVPQRISPPNLSLTEWFPKFSTCEETAMPISRSDQLSKIEDSTTPGNLRSTVTDTQTPDLNFPFTINGSGESQSGESQSSTSSKDTNRYSLNGSHCISGRNANLIDAEGLSAILAFTLKANRGLSSKERDTIS